MPTDELTLRPQEECAEGLDGFSWGELLFMASILGDPQRARESLMLPPKEARASYLKQEEEWAENLDHGAQEEAARGQDPEASASERAFRLELADEKRRWAREARGRARSIHTRIARLGRVHPQATLRRGRGREHRPSPRRRLARTTGSRGDPPPDDDPEPEPELSPSPPTCGLFAVRPFGARGPPRCAATTPIDSH